MLTDKAVQKAVPRERPYKLADAGDLYLYVMPSGGRSWRYKYRFSGKERRLVFGTYSDIFLERARNSGTTRGRR